MISMFMCQGNVCFAQFHIEGKLTDTNGIAISSATVTLLDKGTGIVLAYDITDKVGGFELSMKNKTDVNLWLHFNAVGFFNDSIPITNQLSKLLIVLIPHSKTLPAVTVKNRRSFRTIKPDSSSYKTEDFFQKQDRNIEDVLKKIPGIEIDGSGKISYNGKAISNFYIDGDDIVTDRYSIATRSIRPEMVDKIQLIENHNPIKVLESAVLSNNTALNLSLKDEARLTVMGSVGAGAGNRNTYKLDGDLLSFKKHIKFIDLIKTNNTGVDISSEITPHNFTNLLRRLEQITSKPFLGLGGIGYPEITPQRYLFNKTGLISLNNSFTSKSETQIKLNIHYLNDNRNISSSSQSIYTLPASSYIYDEEKIMENKVNSFNTEFKVTVNKKNYYLNNVFSVNTTKPFGTANMQQNGVKFLQKYENRDWNISDELNILKKKTGRNILELNSYIQYKNSPENLKLFPGLNDSIFNEGKSYQQLRQFIDFNGFFSHQSFSYKLVQDFLVQNYKTGIVMELQQLGSNISTVNNLGVVKQLSDSLLNNIEWRHYKAYVKFDYELISGGTRLSVSLPLYLHYIQKKTGVGEAPENFSKPIFSPSFRWRYDLNTECYIMSNYQYNETPTSIHENFENYILTNYSLLQTWRIPVVFNKKHSASISWSGRNSVKLLTGNVTIGFNTGENEYLSSYFYLSSLQIQKYINGSVKNSNRLVNAGISKYIFPLHTTLSGNFIMQLSDYEQIQQNQSAKFADEQQSMSVRATSKINSWITGSYSVEYINNKSKIITQDNLPEQRTSLLKQHFDINIFPLNKLTIKISGEKFKTKRIETHLANSFFVDAHILYKLGKSNTELSFDATNLTDNINYITYTVSGNNSTQINFPLRRFQVMASIKFRF